jgi:ribose/xylose/arabinose/galactoside ABC-type transport system permease subunit
MLFSVSPRFFASISSSLFSLDIGLILSPHSNDIIPYLSVNVKWNCYMGTVVNGFNYFYTKGIVSGDIPEILLSMGKQIAGPLKTIFFAVLILFFLVYLLQRKRTIGKLVYLIGSNANAAVLCGAKAKMVCAYSFMMSSVLAVFGGVVLLGMSGAAVLKMGEDFVMMSVAAAVIGGIKAGEGKIFGCYLGAVIIQLTSSLLIAANLPDSIRIFLQGIVLLAILSTFASKPRLQQ